MLFRITGSCREIIWRMITNGQYRWLLCLSNSSLYLLWWVVPVFLLKTDSWHSLPFFASFLIELWAIAEWFYERWPRQRVLNCWPLDTDIHSAFSCKYWKTKQGNLYLLKATQSSWIETADFCNVTVEMQGTAAAQQSGCSLAALWVWKLKRSALQRWSLTAQSGLGIFGFFFYIFLLLFF